MLTSSNQQAKTVQNVGQSLPLSRNSPQAGLAPRQTSPNTPQSLPPSIPPRRLFRLSPSDIAELRLAFQEDQSVEVLPPAIPSAPVSSISAQSPVSGDRLTASVPLISSSLPPNPNSVEQNTPEVRKQQAESPQVKDAPALSSPAQPAISPDQVQPSDLPSPPELRVISSVLSPRDQKQTVQRVAPSVSENESSPQPSPPLTLTTMARQSQGMTQSPVSEPTRPGPSPALGQQNSSEQLTHVPGSSEVQTENSAKAPSTAPGSPELASPASERHSQDQAEVPAQLFNEGMMKIPSTAPNQPKPLSQPTNGIKNAPYSVPEPAVQLSTPARSPSLGIVANGPSSSIILGRTSDQYSVPRAENVIPPQPDFLNTREAFMLSGADRQKPPQNSMSPISLDTMTPSLSATRGSSALIGGSPESTHIYAPQISAPSISSGSKAVNVPSFSPSNNAPPLTQQASESAPSFLPIVPPSQTQTQDSPGQTPQERIGSPLTAKGITSSPPRITQFSQSVYAHTSQAPNILSPAPKSTADLTPTNTDPLEYLRGFAPQTSAFIQTSPQQPYLPLEESPGQSPNFQRKGEPPVVQTNSGSDPPLNSRIPAQSALAPGETRFRQAKSILLTKTPLKVDCAGRWKECLPTIAHLDFFFPPFHTLRGIVHGVLRQRAAK